MKYYVAENEQPVGPFEVGQLVARGLKGTDLVWAEGFEGWVPAESVEEIRMALYSPNGASQEYRETAIPGNQSRAKYSVSTSPIPPRLSATPGSHPIGNNRDSAEKLARRVNSRNDTLLFPLWFCRSDKSCEGQRILGRRSV